MPVSIRFATNTECFSQLAALMPSTTLVGHINPDLHTLTVSCDYAFAGWGSREVDLFGAGPKRETITIPHKLFTSFWINCPA